MDNTRVSLQFWGQSGFLIEHRGCRVVIDPYLSDSVGAQTPPFTRLYPPPVRPGEFEADVFVVTHDHLDHLDPDTVRAYAHKQSTQFVAPRHAAQKLRQLGVLGKNISVVGHGDRLDLKDVSITGVFALATSPDVVDTTGYLLTFPGGKTVYHTSDTAWCDLLAAACPQADVLLVCINGKFGNLTAEQAVRLAKAVSPRYAIPHHFDMMALNSENPETFRYFCEEAGLGDACVVLHAMEQFTW